MLNEFMYPIITLAMYLFSCLITKKVGTRIGIESESEKGFSNSLEVLRGMAAFLVFGAHSSMYFGLAPKQVFAGTMGEVGVLLFFMLTGHLFWSQVRNNRYRAESFYKKRILRLVPAYLVVISTFIFLDWARAGFPVPNTTQLIAIIRNYGFGFGTVVNSIGNVNDVFSKDMYLKINSIWTLRWEWLFYLVIPLLAVFNRFYIATLFVLFVCVAFYNPLDLLNGTTDIVFILAFWFGALSAEIEMKKETLFKFLNSRLASSMLLFWGIAGLLLYLFHGEIERKNVRVPYMLLCMFPVFMYFVLSKGFPERLTWKPMQMVGKISYSFYLWHLGINSYVMYIVTQYFHDTQNWTAMILICFVMMLFATVISCFSYKFIEERFMHRKSSPALVPSIA
jgi:peptidoglycan/LPS O-acetylase OafA/YrhL